MKYFVFTICMLCGLLSYGQERTISQSELDSLSNKIDSEELQVIEHVPLYKGCKKSDSNANKIKCMSQKIAKLFHENFNTLLPENSEIELGMKRIMVIFKVDNNGDVIDIEAKAENNYLSTEAKRVAQMIPQMTPGLQKGKPVVVPYALPVRVEVTKEDGKNMRYPIFRGCNQVSSNSALQECSKEKIMNFIKMSFDIEMANRVFPLEKSTQFLLEFNINKKGKVDNVNAKANHKAIAIEAINVAKRLPKFKAPGTLNGKPIDTPFKLLMTLYF